MNIVIEKTSRLPQIPPSLIELATKGTSSLPPSLDLNNVPPPVSGTGVSKLNGPSIAKLLESLEKPKQTDRKALI